jgi:predicted type IV restriction endonuclease
MDLIDRITELAARVGRQKDAVMTEQAAKTAFVLPFLQALGYDVFNPHEVVPELTADHGFKKGEKVDYAIKRDGSIIMLIECKPVGAPLEAKFAGQLFRYFSVTEARVGVLTDGVRYLFFSDLDAANKMDDRPFFEFNLLAHVPADVEELKHFSRASFELDALIGRAADLKYHRLLLAAIQQEFDKPSDELIRMLTTRVYSGRMTQQVRDQFASLLGRALRDFIRLSVNNRLKSALEPERSTTSAEAEKSPAAVAATSGASEAPERGDGIETTEEELEAHRIIRAIGAEIIDVERIVMRDAKSYCAILCDNNNRRPICRLHFGKTRMFVIFYNGEAETRIDLEKTLDLYKHKKTVLASLQQYLL